MANVTATTGHNMATPELQPSQNSSLIQPNIDAILDKLNQNMLEIFIPSFVMILSVIIVGFVGNVITVYIYLKKMRRTTSRIFILALAICDVINCILTMPVEIAIIISFYTFDNSWICAVSRTLTFVLNGISALLLCGIAADRFRKICRPLKPVFTPKKTKLICFVCCALAFVVYIPGYVLYGTHTVTVDVGNNVTVTGKTCLVSDRYSKIDGKGRIAQMVFGVWFLGVVGVLITLVVSYVIIGRAVNQRMQIDQQRKDSVSFVKRNPERRGKPITDFSSETSYSFSEHLDNNRDGPVEVTEPVKMTIKQSLKSRFRLSKPKTASVIKNQRLARRIRAGKTTVVLFAVTIAYFVSFFPFIIIVSLRLVNPNMYKTLNDVEKSVWNFFLRSYVINFAVNPILYGFLNKDFRNKMAEFLDDCCCCFKCTTRVQQDN